MAATSAAAVLNGLGSPFLSSGKKSQALLAAPIGTRSVGGSVALKRFVVVAATAKKSWIPAVKGGGNLIDHKWLDGSQLEQSVPVFETSKTRFQLYQYKNMWTVSLTLSPPPHPTHHHPMGFQVTDYGFDPLDLGKDPTFLKWYREVELIHGRWAMAAVIGIFVGQAWSGIPWFEAGVDPGAVAPFSFSSLLGTQLLLMGWVESKRGIDFFNPKSQSVAWATPWSRTAENFANATGDQGYPGGKFFDPLCLAGIIDNGAYIPDAEKLERLKLAEIKHVRIAMLAMLIFYFEAGQGKTPLGALGL
ncbi:chlorophyll a-b binding protein CP24 10A, chloroplastic-like [Actinidia eriantha]|uniref:chlorophyll a-b binding protein CP24 10A, chloroplastic-like n=1 Tax=Actinidia eriantha TaxID=165200 RepID=UPI0025859BAD|nr:chlorophyll a-b binding protein CP24 10A, chloroplastic-like [Actinidia eriantha]